MRTLILLSTLGAVLLLSASAAAVTMDWVFVGDPGNPADPQESCTGCGSGTVFGSVAYYYQISKYEVTNAEYAEFLNAVAATDTNGLYNTNMGDSVELGGITQTGASGSYSYNAIAGREDMPVNWVSFRDAMRFANWLHNGQPSGAQDGTTTEDGAYTFSGPSTFGPRNVGALIFVPNEDEWYKAAYYDPASMNYFDYPAGSDTPTVCSTPGAIPNTANCESAEGDFTSNGSYTGSTSPYGTFDQGGNVYELTEGIVSGSARATRGGSYGHLQDALSASTRGYVLTDGFAFNPLGFRVAPEPGAKTLLITGVLSVLGLAGWRRVRA